MLSSFGKVALTCCFLTAVPVSAWWETGHRTVARLAVLHLTSAARARIARLLSVPDDPVSLADALAIAATWADETKVQTQTGSWHFIDLTLQDDKTDIPARCPNDNCVTARIRLFATQLASRPASPGPISDLDALRYLVHFVGDIHQPLHAVSNADLGGNCEQVDPPVNTAKNLHAIWDGAIVDSFNLGDRNLAASLETAFEAYSPQLRADLAFGNEDDWAWESHKLAVKDVYRSLNIPEQPILFPASCAVAPPAVAALIEHLPPDYIPSMQPVVREQLIKAGLRLARLLNEASSPAR